MNQQTFAKFLQVNGFKIANRTIVNATIIHSPPSTKNKDKARDPDANQTKKGNQWYSSSKHLRQRDALNRVALARYLHGDETHVWGDSAYAGQQIAMKEAAPNARDFTQKKAARNRPLSDVEQLRNRTKSSVRAKVEHVFGVIKRVFGYTKTRYRGIDKNAHAMFVVNALANIFMVRRQLLQA